MSNDLSLYGESYRATIDDMRSLARRDPSWWRGPLSDSGLQHGISRDAIIARAAAAAAVAIVLLVLGIGFGLTDPAASPHQDNTARSNVTGVVG